MNTMRPPDDSDMPSMRYGDYLRYAAVPHAEIRYGDVVRVAPRGHAAHIGLTPRHVYRIIAPYLSVRFGEQARAVLPLVVYLAAFHILILRQSIDHALLVAGGLFGVIFGLTLFMEGLKVGLMPFAERIGSELPVKLPLRGILTVAFAIGAAATVAEPAIGALQTMGGAVSMTDAPLLYMILNQHAGYLVLAVALGVGGATVLGVFRSLRGWSLKPVILALTIPACLLTLYAYMEPSGQLLHLIGLAWDCGGATTGPVTVPIVLALGVGVSQTSARGKGFSGFGVVTLSSLLPVITVLALGIILLHTTAGSSFVTQTQPLDAAVADVIKPNAVLAAIISALRAVIPLCLLLFGILSWILHARMANRRATLYGMVLCLLGMAAFNIGLTYGLGALGNQVGAAIPTAFDDHKATVPSSLHMSFAGLTATLLFSFFLGLGATLAEPALRAFALTVENITNGVLERSSIIRAVSLGVGVGIATGIATLLWDFSITPLLFVGYPALLVMTFFSSEKYVNVAWDSAGVTTGPVTVPLVIALGLGLGQAQGIAEGFGILAMASMFPIGSVLLLGLISERRVRLETAAAIPSAKEEDVEFQSE